MNFSNAVFPHDPEVEFLGPRKRQFVMPFECILNADGVRWDIVLPIGFITDFASVPRIFWTIFPPEEGRWDDAAAVHDFLYANGGKIKVITNLRSVIPVELSRADCDAVFLAGMQGAGVSLWQRYTMYSAVRAFGGLFFKGDSNGKSQ